MEITSQVDLEFQPLAGRTIVITRARAQAEEFAAQLEKYGARVISCPTIEIAEPNDYELLDEAIDNLYGYDWLIFTSVNGINYFLRRFAERGHESHELDDLRVCAIGESSAAALRDLHVHVDVVPEQFQAEGVFTALKNYLGDVEAFRSLNFLIPRASAARGYLPLALEEVGARVDVVTAYRTVRPRSSELARVAALLEGGAIDCIAFSSSSSVTNFAQLFDTADLGHLLKGVAVACIGEVTATTAAQFGLNADIRPREQTIAALARAIADFY
jgi:uroporphyrinogen III methyltransferase/synthase